MKSTNKYIVDVLAVGFMTLVILSVLLFWCRKFCREVFYEVPAAGTGYIQIQPSGLVPKLDSDPNVVVSPSYIWGSFEDGAISHSSRFVEGLLKTLTTREFSMVGRDKDEEGDVLVLFDKHSGLFVFYEIFKEKRGWSKKVRFYAGPKGTSKTTDKDLGRFSKLDMNLWVGHLDSFTFFDKSSSCFFHINFYKEAVVKGPGLADDYRPVQVGGCSGLNKNGRALGSFGWNPPLRERTAQDKEDKKNIRATTRTKDGRRVEYVPVSDDMGTHSNEYSLVLDESGEIRKLDNKTLELSGRVGYLPFAPPWYRRGLSVRPDELFAYKVFPFVIGNEYAGTIAGTVSREAMGMRIAVFGPNGKLVKESAVSLESALDKGGGPALGIAMYILENLQPAFLGLVSYFSSSSFEAASGHSGLFILPNSFVAMFGRDSIGIIGPLFGALLIILPSIILGLFLGWRVHKDGTITGFSKRSKLYWLIGTVVFGLAAYISYRLTRPRETLVSCPNCGRLRRPDMDKCHRCGSGWVVAEMVAPNWRVINRSFTGEEQGKIQAEDGDKD
jgi:hypothetical protein